MSAKCHEVPLKLGRGKGMLDGTNESLLKANCVNEPVDSPRQELQKASPLEQEILAVLHDAGQLHPAATLVVYPAELLVKMVAASAYFARRILPDGSRPSIRPVTRAKVGFNTFKRPL